MCGRWGGGGPCTPLGPAQVRKFLKNAFEFFTPFVGSSGTPPAPEGTPTLGAEECPSERGIVQSIKKYLKGLSEEHEFSISKFPQLLYSRQGRTVERESYATISIPRIFEMPEWHFTSFPPWEFDPYLLTQCCSKFLLDPVLSADVDFVFSVWCLFFFPDGISLTNAKPSAHHFFLRINPTVRLCSRTESVTFNSI